MKTQFYSLHALKSVPFGTDPIHILGHKNPEADAISAVNMTGSRVLNHY